MAGYATGGTLHVVANNQVGFTTDPAEGRSTRYSSDLAKGFDSPIFHVNADDPEAAIAAIRLAMAFRARFRHDVVVDLVGYRRFGHNEQDEPAYTQPLMAKRDRSANLRCGELYAQARWRARASSTRGARRGASCARSRRPEGGARAAEGASLRRRASSASAPERRHLGVPRTAVEEATLTRAERGAPRRARRVHGPPEARSASSSAAGRRSVPEGGIDWGQAEALAFASLRLEGVPVRLTGQDSERGTFSHRHLVLHDARPERQYAPIQHLSGAAASFEV